LHRIALLLLLGAGLAAPAAAQADASLRMSFRAFEEQSWLLLLDRDGGAGGRISERGFLQRFDPRIDNRYHLDLTTAAFSPRDDYTWYALTGGSRTGDATARGGARWRGGSINKSTLATDLEFRAEVPISGSWSTGLRLDRRNNAEGDQTALRVSLARALSRRVTLFATGHLDTRKEDSDLELGVLWSLPAIRGGRLALSATALDFVNNLIYLTFDAATQPGRDSTLEYLDRPLALRGSAALPLGEALRLEAWGAWQGPARVLQYDSLDASAGLRQRESAGYAGGSLEWAAGRDLRLALWAAGIWARTERDPITPAAPVAGFDLRERTTLVGIHATGRLGARWLLDLAARQGWFPERRDWSDPGTPDLDFLFRMSSAQALLTYTAERGFTLDGGVGWSKGSTPRGAGSIPYLGNLRQHWLRLRADVGLIKTPRVRFLVGGALDYDLRPGIATPATFGGARGRVMLLW
jgi:hypothetical protein